ncbi:FbpB family small basic protein [Sutcliffiella cohnii]|uniref:FbpB family small basic protein n=1 Tax=Sutcliffiella cohnii TaxID=33932 RepID=A0A223KKJ3_9BACI|nr:MULTISPECIES: FbpB family small basic protein [Sutcliffiella]AST89888.1 hypothetical protein BC6307_00650 [Sutcliffiella cohnii]MED4018237.1 FbpB family small basic protein [Sutcliffiella cohnii]WBL15511.1 FbpB family small basic protein [Sutcliffiella sp. NC1]
MKKVKLSFSELMKENKEELLKDREQMEKIEKRLEEKYVGQK